MAIAVRDAQVPRMVRGSVVVQKRRCGKANCHCASGPARHETTVLNYSEGGRTRAVMLPTEAVGQVRAAVERYRAAQKALEDKANAGLEELVRTWGKRRPGP